MCGRERKQEEKKGEERRERRRGKEEEGEERNIQSGRVTHLKEGAVLHGTNNQRDVRCQRLHLVEAGDHLHLDI